MKVPKGWRIAKRGKVRRGDRVWASPNWYGGLRWMAVLARTVGKPTGRFVTESLYAPHANGWYTIRKRTPRAPRRKG